MNIWELHPMLVHFPIAFLTGAVALDLFAWWRARVDLAGMATGLLIAGVITGWLAANFGLLAFYTVPAHTEDAHRWMLWHLTAAVVSLGLFTCLAAMRWFHRSRHVSGAARVMGLVGLILLMVVGYLGGQIVYHGGAGVEPKLLAAELRGGHAHGHASGRAGEDDHEDRTAGRESTPHDTSERSPEHQETRDQTNHADAAKGAMTPNAHAEHDGNAVMPRADTDGEEEDRTHGTQAPVTTEPVSEHSDHGRTPLPKRAADLPDSTKESGHSSGFRDLPKRDASPLGPDFERNVQQNRLRNMP